MQRYASWPCLGNHREYDYELLKHALRCGILVPWYRSQDASLNRQFTNEYVRFARDFRVAFLRSTQAVGEEMQKYIWTYVVPATDAPAATPLLQSYLDLPLPAREKARLKKLMWRVPMYERNARFGH